MPDNKPPESSDSLLEKVEGAEKVFLAGRRSREADLPAGGAARRIW
jgi:hypothetical protein